MVHYVRYLAFGVLQDKGNILLHEIFKVLKFKTHGGERVAILEWLEGALSF